MKLYYSSRLFRLPWMGNFNAITLMPFGVFFRLSKDEVTKQEFAHEMVHVDQIKRLGIIKFYSCYLFEWIRNLIKYRDAFFAYAEISFEKEAYEKTENIES